LPNEEKRRVFSMLPDGSQLKDVMLPRYDENRRLIGALKADVMRLVTAGEIAGETVAVEFYGEGQARSGRIDLAKATFYEETQLLVAREAVEMRADRMTASGTALHYDFGQSEGFLSGPCDIFLPNAPETAMNAKPSTPRMTAAVGLSLLAQSLTAAPPPPVTAEQQAEIRAAATTLAPQAAEASQATRKDLRETLKKSEEVTRAATAFLDKADLLAAEAQATPTAPAAEPKPLEVPPPGPDGVRIRPQGGFYFDMDGGVGSFLKNVTVSSPDFDLSGADEVKVFFSKPPAGDAPEKDGKSDSPFGGKMGDIERIMATGAILIKQKNPKPGEDPIHASGGLFSYNVKTGDIVISGRYPWFTQGPQVFLRAKERDLILRIDKNFKAITEGDWEAGFPTEKKAN
jgi:hypothetical protein